MQRDLGLAEATRLIGQLPDHISKIVGLSRDMWIRSGKVLRHKAIPISNVGIRIQPMVYIKRLFPAIR